MRIDGMALPQLINIKGLNDILGKLLVGDKFQVQVIKIDGNELTLRLPNGQSVSTSVLEPFALNLGDFLELAVKSKTENQIVLQTVTDTNEQTKIKDVADTLISFKIPPDERNIDIGKSMINQHISLNKDNFKAILNVLGTFEDMDIEKAAFIVANNIESISKGMELLDRFESNQASVGKSVNKLINLLALSVDGLNLSKIFSSFEKQAVAKATNDNDLEIQGIINNYISMDEDDANLAKLFVKQAIVQSNNPSSTIESLLEHQISKNNLGYLLDSNENIELYQFMSEKPGFEDKLIKYLNDKASLDRFIIQFSKENPAVFKKLSSSDSDGIIVRLNNFFKDVINNIKDGRIKKDINVNKLYDNLQLKMDVIEEHLEKYSIPNSDRIGHMVSEIKSEINLIKNIDNMFNFYQLPFVINQNNATVDMYILKNSREHRVIDPDNATLFLSLNTKNLGQVEVLVNVRDKVVGLNFKLENERTINFFESKNGILENLILGKGYATGKVKFALSTKRTNVVNFEKTLKEEKNIVMDVFDVKV